MTSKKPFNPFYFLLLIVGTVFAITAFAYGVMTLRLSQDTAAPVTTSGATLMDFLAQHGTVLLLIELGILAVLTVGAIGTDEFWSRRAESETRKKKEEVGSDTQPT